jgi:uncharacterized membrane protein YeaQ/YmgE (transglycosylase-associated protein family)
MAAIFSHSPILADGVTIALGGHVWTFGTNVIVYIIIAAIVGILAEFIVGWRLPFGIVGAIIAGIIGVWLMTQVIVISGFGDITVDGVPLIRALIGAIILIAIWHLLTYRSWSSRSRYSRR